MRAPNIGTAAYTPNQVPSDPTDLPRFLREELDRIAAVVAALAAGHLDKQTVVPRKPRDGDVRYADGANWNPGSGQGVYYFNGSIWKLLG